jgi:Na+-driven multidrug efflux pump
MFGEGSYTKASQVVADLLRFSIVLGLIVPAICIPIARPLMKWYGAADDVADLGLTYVAVVVGGTLITCVYLLLCGCLQAEGRTFLFGAVQIVSMALCGAVFDPLSIVVFMRGIEGPAFSILLSQLLPAVRLLIAFFRGKFTLRLRWGEFFRRPIPESWHALAIGATSLLSSLSSSLPMVLFQKFLGVACNDENEFNVMMSLFNAFSRLYVVVIALYLSVCMGLLASGSFAYSARNISRVVLLAAHAFWVLGVMGGLVATLLNALARPFARIFSRDPLFIERFQMCMAPYWSTTMLLAWLYLGTCLLQVVNRPVRSLICTTIGQIVIFPVVSCFFFFTDKRNAPRLFWSGVTNDTVAFIVTVLFDIPAVKELRDRRRDEIGYDNMALLAERDSPATPIYV